jgi:hypothetical protein
MFQVAYNALFALLLALCLPVSVLATDLSQGEVVSGYPAEVRSLLAKHPVWVTVVYSAKKIPDRDGLYLSVNQSKKWSVHLNGNVAQSLDETTELSLSFNPTNENVSWSREHVDLHESISSKPFYFEGNFENAPSYQIRFLSGDRFEIVSTPSQTHVVFVPEWSAKDLRYEARFKHVNIWTAPLGPARSGDEIWQKLDKPETVYLHHNLSNPVRVLVDTSYPQVHLKALQDSVNEWNSALGRDLFQLQSTPIKLDLSDCFSSRTLCVKWEGLADVAWTGVGGSTSFSFDPESGEILGGVIEFKNTAKNSLVPTPGDYDQRFVSGEIDTQWAAEVFLKQSEFARYRHPLPELIVKKVLVHEMGHFNGFAHNFEGSLHGTIQNPTETVMDYLPFSAIRDVSIGSFDRQMILAIYSGTPPTSDYRFCSDVERDGVSGRYPKKAECNAYDVGDPVNWYMMLADMGSDGVFTKLPDLRSPLYFLGAFLREDGNSTLGSQSKVRAFLCKNPENRKRITDELMKQCNVELQCF